MATSTMKIQSVDFGKIVIDGKSYGDILIIDNKIIPRDINALHKLFHTAHIISDEECALLNKNNPEVIVIGTGVSGLLRVDERIKNKIKAKEIIILPTQSASEKYNLLVNTKKLNALFHTTC